MFLKLLYNIILYVLFSHLFFKILLRFIFVETHIYVHSFHLIVFLAFYMHIDSIFYLSNLLPIEIYINFCFVLFLFCTNLYYFVLFLFCFVLFVLNDPYCTSVPIDLCQSFSRANSWK